MRRYSFLDCLTTKTGVSVLAALWFLIALVMIWQQAERQNQLSVGRFAMEDVQQFRASDVPVFIKQTISLPQDAASVHAASLTKFNDGLLAAWFAGEREGATDVQIFASTLSLNQKHAKTNHVTPSGWSRPYVILSRALLAQKSGTYIKKLGNPVLYQAEDGKVHLFVVGVSLGGWAGSRIYHLVSQDGKAFDFLQTLQLSPLMNNSHLVRATPVALQDGGFYLPIYHEFAQKFELLLRFDKTGKLIAKSRPNQLMDSLQPWLAPLSEYGCAMIRRNGQSSPMMLQRCQKGVDTWSLPVPLNIDNDNNSANIHQFFNHTLLAHNKKHFDNDRFDLMLSVLDITNAKAVPLTILDRAGLAINDTPNIVMKKNIPVGEVSYPTMLSKADRVHLVYTHDRTQIRHIEFNQAWLNQVLSDQPK